MKEEGLEAIAASHPRSDASAPVRELFSRCAKSLVLSGAADPAQGDRVLGFTLELVAEKNPYSISTSLFGCPGTVTVIRFSGRLNGTDAHLNAIHIVEFFV